MRVLLHWTPTAFSGEVFIRFQRFFQHFWPRICAMTPLNVSIISWIFLPAQTFEFRDVGPNRRKYRNLTCLILFNYSAGFWQKSQSFSEIFSESLTKGMGHYPSKFQHHSVNILSLGVFLKTCGTSPHKCIIIVKKINA